MSVGIENSKSILTKMPNDRAILLDNISCAYCGVNLHKQNKTKEHVVGRRFVPKGTLHQNWNLIVQACKPCNNEKSDLENDISAITMLPDTLGVYASDDQVLISESKRKSNQSISRHTKKPVSESYSNLKVNVDIGPALKANFDLTGFPHIDEQRLFRLALLQARAFFYFITFSKETRKGRFWRGGFYPIGYAQKLDWGNDRLVEFMRKVKNWEPRFVGNNADGYFRSMIRRHPEAACWSWVFEWNRCYRLAGLFGDEKAAKLLASDLPNLVAREIPFNGEGNLFMRIEKPLNEEDDLFQYWDDGR